MNSVRKLSAPVSLTNGGTKQMEQRITPRRQCFKVVTNLMIHPIKYFVLIVLICVSCLKKQDTSVNQIKNSTSDTLRAIAFYDSISYQINLTGPPIQRFLDKTGFALLELKSDPKAVIDIPELQLLLDSARRMNKIRLFSISKIVEIDSEINYKQRILSKETILMGLLKNEIPACLEIFAENTDDRQPRCSHLILPKLEKLREALDDVQKAKIEFKDKYRFTTPEK
jgi:hypothetical protein